MMKNIDIVEWLLNNNLDPLTEIIADGKQLFLSDILEEHLKEQLKATVVGRSEQLFCNCSQGKGVDIDEDGFPYCIDCQKNVAK